VFALKITDTRDDQTLIDEVLDGDHAAFSCLVERYQERIHGLIARFTRDRMEVEDLSQEVFIKLFRKLHTFQRDSSFYTWLYRIAVNTATDFLSRRKRHPLYLVEDTAVLDGGSRGGEDREGAAGPALAAEQRHVTRCVLDRLPEKYRTILVLREYEEMSYTAIAEVLGCSIGTVESRLFRARRRFRDALERLHPDFVPQAPGGTGS